jgi:hypothetical protein
MVLDLPDPDLLVRSINPDRDHAPDPDPKKLLTEQRTNCYNLVNFNEETGVYSYM